MESPIRVKTLGGELQVAFELSGNGFRYIYLIGPAKQVFSGSVPVAVKV
jgi:diaminopimelate epimerase